MNEARLLLDKWQDIGKNDVQWNIQYGWTYYLEQNYKEAIPFFDRVEDLTPKDTYMLGYLQECNEEIGNTEEAKRIKNWIKEINTLKDTGDKYKKENYYKDKVKM
jgi:tetratricopeptide (TPR) repeat protein